MRPDRIPLVSLVLSLSCRPLSRVLSDDFASLLSVPTAVYIDLENLAEDIDCLALEGNIYTSGLTFASLESAYVRLVNADTNQEMLRCPLDRQTQSPDQRPGASGNTKLMTSRAMVFAKIFRGRDRWVVHTAVEPREVDLRQLPLLQPDMVFGYTSQRNEIQGAGGEGGEEESKAEPPPYRRPEPSGPVYDPVLGTTVITVAPVPTKTNATEQSSTRSTSSSSSSSPRSFMLPAVALGTAAGVAAAVALFATDSPLSVENMNPYIFAEGVDFSSLPPLQLGTDCGCLHDFDCNLGPCGGHMNVGDVCAAPGRRKPSLRPPPFGPPNARDTQTTRQGSIN